MTGNPSWAVRILAELVRVASWTARGFLAAVGADPVALVAFGVLVLTALLSAPLVWKTAVMAGRRVNRSLAARREHDAFEEIVEHFNDDFPSDDPASAQHMDDTVRIAPYTAPLPRRVVRRRPRFPRRPMRRPTSPSSDRSSRP